MGGKHRWLYYWMDLFPRVHCERRLGPTWTYLLWVLVGGHSKLGLQTSDGGQKEGSGLGHLGGLLGFVAQLKDRKMEANVRHGVLTLAHIMWAQTEWIQLKEKDGSNCQEWHSDPGPPWGAPWVCCAAERQKDGSNHQVWCSDPGPHSVGTERMNTADLGNDGSCFYMLCNRNNNVNTDMDTYLHWQMYVHTDTCKYAQRNIPTKINLNHSPIKLEKIEEKREDPPPPPPQ